MTLPLPYWSESVWKQEKQKHLLLLLRQLAASDIFNHRSVEKQEKQQNPFEHEPSYLKTLVDILWLILSGKKLGGGAHLGSDSSRQDLGELLLLQNLKTSKTEFCPESRFFLQKLSCSMFIEFVYISNRSSACLSSLWCRSWSISGMRPPRGWSTVSPTTRTPPSKSTSPSTSDSWSISSSGYVVFLYKYFEIKPTKGPVSQLNLISKQVSRTQTKINFAVCGSDGQAPLHVRDRQLRRLLHHPACSSASSWTAPG